MTGATKERLEDLKERVSSLLRDLKVHDKTAELKRLDGRMAAPGFWDRPDEAQRTVKQVSRLKAETQPYLEVDRLLDDQKVLLDLAAEEECEKTCAEVASEVDRLAARVERLETQAMLSGENDAKNAYLTVHAGAGGTESCDWAQMLLRMYLRWAEKQGMKTEVVDVLDGEEAGIKYATVHVAGSFAYGLLKSELGVHRLVRISPFDAQSRRHTSFASADVVPEFDEDIEVDIKESDLKIDTFRAGGAGGQHVNKTNSAVRITHLPTNIVVQCQNERSQHQNRRVAMKLLQAKLYRIEESKREAEFQKAYDAKGEIAWGHQIRSYVLQPYTLVKDHRTDVEVGDAQAVLDGEIDRFMEGYLKWKLQGGK
jgi:peptide chain release factor 2